MTDRIENLEFNLGPIIGSEMNAVLDSMSGALAKSVIAQLFYRYAEYGREKEVSFTIPPKESLESFLDGQSGNYGE